MVKDSIKNPDGVLPPLPHGGLNAFLISSFKLTGNTVLIFY